MTTDRDLARHVYHCAVAADLAYLGATVLTAQASAAGFHVVARLDRGTNSGVVLDRADVRVVAFRGTDEAADWRTNLNLLPRSTPWGRVHRGFHDAAEAFWPDVAEYARVAADAGQRVWVTGHSLGGAIATLVAVRLAAEVAAIDRLCTFGQPAVGASAFCEHCAAVFADRYIRCVNHTDAVADAIWGEHAGTLWYFDVDGHLHHDVSFRRDLLDHVMAPRRFGGLSQITAHSMTSYLPVLRALMGDSPADE